MGKPRYTSPPCRNGGSSRAFTASLLVVAGLALCPPLRGGGPELAGIWTGSLDILGQPHQVALLLHPRGGEVYGYALGASALLTLSRGELAGDRLSFRVHATSPAGAITYAVAGTLSGATFDGNAIGGGATRAVRLRRRAASDLLERRFVVIEDEAGFETFNQFAVALDPAGRLVAGSFVAHERCGPLGCSGGLEAFTETATRLTLGFSRADCGGGSQVTLTWDDKTRGYRGDYTVTGCDGGKGDAVGARGTRAAAADVAAMLAALARVADDLEARRPLAPPHPSFLRNYLHSGAKERHELAELSAQAAAYDPLNVTFDRFRNASTVDDPTTLPELDRAFGLDFHDRRKGRPLAGGDAVIVRDSDVDTLLDRDLLYFGRNAAGVWGLRGDGLPELDLPFAYTFGSDHLRASTPGGPVFVSVGPWGAHVTPFTGHANGDAKANLVGYLAYADSELVEVRGDGDGVREPREVWGYWDGGDGSRIRDRVPVYRSPYAGEVVAIEYFRGPSSFYFDSPPQWDVRLEYPSGLRLDLGHVGRLAPPLRDALLAATGIDSHTYAGPPGDLLAGHRLPVARHAPLAYPQVVATALPGYPGYWVGGGTFPDVPWAQMEFRFVAPVGGRREIVCHYRHLMPARRAAIAGVFAREIANPTARRFTNAAGPLARWQWAAETELCLGGYTQLPRDFSTLFTQLGGWFERPAPGAPADEIFAFFPLATRGPGYEPALWSPGVRHLALRRRRGGDPPFSWPLPGGATARPYYPAAEVLAQTASTLLLRWRDLVAPGDGWFQRASYRLSAEGLAIRWGPLAASAAAAAAPAPLVGGEPCDGVAVVCYDHTHQPGL